MIKRTVQMINQAVVRGRQRLGRTGLGWLILVLALLSIGGRAGWLMLCEAEGRKLTARIAADYGAVGIVFRSVQSDPAGQRITYARTTESGVGIYLHDLKDDTRTLVRHEGADARPYRVVWPWSPDGRFFVFSWADELVICDGKDGKEVASFTLQGTSGVSWLDTNSFMVWDGMTGRYLVRRNEGADWNISKLSAGPDRIFSRRVIGTNAVAWILEQNVWSMNVNDGATNVWFANDPKCGSLRPFSDYDRETGRLLFARGVKQDIQLWEAAPNGSVGFKLRQLPADRTLSTPMWINQGRGYAYLCARPKGSALKIHTDAAAPPKMVFDGGNIDLVVPAPDGNRLFIIGSRSNEPVAGIWSYDLPSGALRSLVPAVNPTAKVVLARPRVYEETITTASRRRVHYQLFLPDGFDRGKAMKYPLVMHGSHLRSGMFAEASHPQIWDQALARRGALVAVVTRADWYDKDGKAGEDLLFVYQHLLKNPAVDASRIFLYASSAETSIMTPLVEAHPELWAGMLYLDSSNFPKLEKLPAGQRCPPLLLSVGANDGLVHYYRAAEKHTQLGVPVSVHVVSNATHYPVSINARRDKAEGIMRFVFDL